MKMLDFYRFSQNIVNLRIGCSLSRPGRPPLPRSSLKGACQTTATFEECATFDECATFEEGAAFEEGTRGWERALAGRATRASSERKIVQVSLPRRAYPTMQGAASEAGRPGMIKTSIRRALERVGASASASWCSVRGLLLERNRFARMQSELY